jgi:hypothetical protein
MTAPLPPVSGPAGDGTEQEKMAYPQGALAGDIVADHPDLSGTLADATSAGDAWNAGASQWADSPQGAGADGFTLTDEGATGEWDSDVSFPHQGP